MPVFGFRPKAVYDAFFGDLPAKSGLVFRKPMAGLQAGARLSYRGTMPFLLPLAAVAGGMAPPGERVAQTAGLLAAPAGTLIGGLIAGPWGAVAGTLLLDPAIHRAVSDGVSAFSKLGGNIARPEMGQGFTDTEGLYTMRRRAAHEMGRSLLNARQYLGKEALLMHQ